MDFDTLWEGFWRIVPKYANSHIYDIMSYVSGTVAMLITLMFKNSIKAANRKKVFTKFGYDVYDRPMLNKHAGMSYRRRNMLIALLAFIIGCLCFMLVAKLSYRIRVSTYWLPMAGLTAIAEYTFMEQFLNGWYGRLIELLIINAVSIINSYYCMNNEDHHKACLAIRTVVIVFGLAGLMGQFFFSDIDKWRHKSLSSGTSVQIPQPDETDRAQ